MRWDWQIGRVTPLQRTGAAVDIYDIDGFLTTRAEVTAIKTTWQAGTLPHPRTVCYLDLAWENYRPDASPGGDFPAAALGNVYFGFPAERWVDFRQLDALKPMLGERIGMCAVKGFDAVELDDIDGFDPPSTTGFDLTPGDVQNYLAYAFNLIHEYGMTGLWKNSPYLSSWGREYSDGAVVEECYLDQPASPPVRRQPPVRDHLHRAVRRHPVRLGRLHRRRPVGRRGRVRRRRLRVQSRSGVPGAPLVRRLLPRGVRGPARIRGRQVRRRPGRQAVLPLPEITGARLRSLPESVREEGVRKCVRTTASSAGRTPRSTT